MSPSSVASGVSAATAGRVVVVVSPVTGTVTLESM